VEHMQVSCLSSWLRCFTWNTVHLYSTVHPYSMLPGRLTGSHCQQYMPWDAI